MRLQIVTQYICFQTETKRRYEGEAPFGSRWSRSDPRPFHCFQGDQDTLLVK